MVVLHRVLLLVLCLLPLGVAADQVTPNERVQEHINFRTEPEARAPLAGILRKGDSLELLGSVPWWHKVRLPNGQPAFASKAWSTVISEATSVPAGTTYAMHVVDVGTGLAIYVQGPDFNLVYDAGSMDDRSTGDNNRFVAYLKAVNPALSTIDHVIISHPHRDHIVLLPDVFAGY